MHEWPNFGLLRTTLDDPVSRLMVRPMSDLGLYLAGMSTWPSRETPREWLRLNDRFRRDILDLLGTSGPLLSRDIPDTSAGGVAVDGVDQ